MSRDIGLHERMRRANPVPDPHQPPADAWDRDTALLAIRQRMEEDARSATTVPKPRVGLVVAAAAFVAVVVIAAAVLLLSGGTNRDVPPSATTTTVPATSTTAATTTTTPSSTTTTTTTTAAPLFPGIPQIAFGPLEPGPVTVETTAVPLTFIAPDITPDFPLGLWVDRPAGPGVGLVPRDAIQTDLGYPPPSLIFVMTRADDDSGLVADEIAAEFGTDDRNETTVGGHSAILIDAGVVVGDNAFPLASLDPEAVGEPEFGVIPGTRHRFYVVDAPDGTLVVWLDIWDEAWDILSPYWEEAVASIEFPDER